MPRTRRPSHKLLILLVPLLMIIIGIFLLIKIIEKKRIIDGRDIFTSIELTLPGEKKDSIITRMQNAPFIIIFFEPDCYYCHVETDAMIERIDELAGINIYMITTNELKTIEEFTAQYNLDDYQHILTGQVCMQSFYKSYGARAVPSLFIYDKTGKLLYNNSGYTPVSDILEVLNR